MIKNDFIKSISMTPEGHFHLIIPSEKQMALSSFFFRDEADGHYDSQSLDATGLLILFDEETLRLYLEANARKLPQDVVESILIDLGAGKIPYASSRPKPQKSDVTKELLQALSDWTNTYNNPSDYENRIVSVIDEILQICHPHAERKYGHRPFSGIKKTDSIRDIVKNHDDLKNFLTVCSRINAWPGGNLSSLEKKLDGGLGSAQWANLFIGREVLGKFIDWAQMQVDNNLSSLTNEPFSEGMRSSLQAKTTYLKTALDDLNNRMERVESKDDEASPKSRKHTLR